MNTKIITNTKEAKIIPSAISWSQRVGWSRRIDWSQELGRYQIEEDLEFDGKPIFENSIEITGHLICR